MDPTRKRSEKKEKKRSNDKSVELTGVDSMDEEILQAERQRKKILRHAKKQAKLFAELGLDENGNPLDNFSLLKYPVRECVVTLPFLHDPIALNPVVTLIGVAVLWGLVLWTSVHPARAMETLVAMRSSVSLKCTWIFQGSKSILFFFMMYIAYKYGHIHMGDAKSKPEFSNFSYFSMIFSSGVGVGLLIYCVPEPLWHQESHFYAQTGYRSQDEKDMFAINMTVTNWAITGWVHYMVTAVAMSLAGHRFGLPFTFRSVLFPILGPYTWGWMGDVIDGLTIVVSVSGIVTNLGLGSDQIVTGLLHMGWVQRDGTRDQITSIQNTVVWVITAMTSASVISGVYGKCLLSVTAVLLACLLGCLVLMMDDSKFLLNLVVQESGYFLQTSLLQLNFWTDAFGQLREGEGRAIDGKAAEQWWMDLWMVFYQAWVITWAAFIGVFVASISRGRKLREIVLYSFFLPLGFCLVWFTSWGGVALRQSRQGRELQALGATYFNNSAHFSTDGDELCYDVPQEDVVVGDEVIFTNYLPGVTPVCLFDPETSNKSIFRVLYSFKYPGSFGAEGLGPVLSVLFLICCFFYFATSSDTCALVVDGLASNGRKNQHWARRTFWVTTVGALTSVLLSAGGAEALYAVQAASIVCGLPVAVVMCYLIQTITLFCRAADQSHSEEDYRFPDQPEFDTPIYGGIFNVIEYAASLGKVNEVRVALDMHQASKEHIAEFVKGIVVPTIPLSHVLASSYPDTPKTNFAVVVSYTASYFGWVVVALMSRSRPGLSGLAWTLFVANGLILGMIRAGFRARHNIRSNAVADFVAGWFFWPQVFVQMRTQCLEPMTLPSESKKQFEKKLQKEDIGMGLPLDC